MENLLGIRVDASREIGTGHLMRCLALAERWTALGGEAVFIGRVQPPGLAELLRIRGFEAVPLVPRSGSLEEANETNAIARSRGVGWLVVDGYSFSSQYLASVQDELKMLVIDDTGETETRRADLVLNQNIHAVPSFYRDTPPGRLLLGPRYALLRREFLRWRDWQRTVPHTARSILVTLGGSDAANMTARILRGIRSLELPGIRVAAVIGAASADAQTLRDEFVSDSGIHFVQAPHDMSWLMAGADVAVSATGSTCWELAFMGLPSAVLAVAENQRVLGDQLGQLGYVLNLGWHDQVGPQDVARALGALLADQRGRERMAAEGRRLVDGDGADRVVMWLRDMPLRIRPVHADECRLLWTWASDAATRDMSFSPGPIGFEEYERWFARKLHDPDSVLLLAVDREDQPEGQIRFDLDHLGEAVVDVSIARDSRLSTVGVALIREGVRALRRQARVPVVHAMIGPRNIQWAPAFQESGFRCVEAGRESAHSIVHFVNER